MSKKIPWTTEDIPDQSGKIAIVTGANSGIGFETARALALHGTAAILACRNLEKGQAAVDQIRSQNPRGQAILQRLDLADLASVGQFAENYLAKFDRLDILINNAGVFGAAPIDEMSTETWDRLIATDLRAPFLCTRAAFRIMKKQGIGRIVNIGSVSAQRVRPNNAAYSAAKFGLVGLTHTTALEGRKYGICCGVLHPGEVFHEGRPIEMQKEPGMTTDEIAAAAVYMACQPPGVNVLELIQLNPQQLYVGRG